LKRLPFHASSRQDFPRLAAIHARAGERDMVVSTLHGRSDALDFIEADRVTLRRPQPGDYEEWAHLRARSRAFLTPWEPAWSLDELSRAAYRRRLRRYSREAREGLAAPFFVFRAEDDALVGGCNLNNIRRGVLQACSIGYWVGEPFSRRGYTRDAARAAVGFAFRSLDLHRVEAACIPSNEASRALLEKLGFRREGVARSYLKINGVWRDHLLYAVVADDWRG
jgi:ribosomal-protein-alanine N-acetyltransferase